MTPKEKAEELINKFILHTEKYNDGWIESDRHAAKVCALILVDEIIEQYEFDVASDVENKRFITKLNYWDEVKQEIEKL
jgi:hypothetical protein